MSLLKKRAAAHGVSSTRDIAYNMYKKLYSLLFIQL